MDKIIQKLSEIEPLNPAQHEALLALQPFMKNFTLKKGQYLYQYGDIPDYVVFIDFGILRHVINDSNENEKILRFYMEDDFIEDCQSFNEQKPVEYSVQALEDCELSYFKFMEVVHLYTEYPEFEKIGRKMTESNASIHVGHLTLLMKFNPDERYQYIMKNEPHLIRRLTVTHLAQYLDLSRETLSRVRAKVVGNGIM
jgi:CRP-like cAMP-binding protein